MSRFVYAGRWGVGLQLDYLGFGVRRSIEDDDRENDGPVGPGIVEGRMQLAVHDLHIRVIPHPYIDRLLEVTERGCTSASIDEDLDPLLRSLTCFVANSVPPWALVHSANRGRNDAIHYYNPLVLSIVYFFGTQEGI